MAGPMPVGFGRQRLRVRFARIPWLGHRRPGLQLAEGHRPVDGRVRLLRHAGDGAAAERYIRNEGLPSVGWLMVLLQPTFYGARTAASIVGRARPPRGYSMSAKTIRRPPVASAMTLGKNAPASTVAAAWLAVS
jgi:hypothetical protein